MRLPLPCIPPRPTTFSPRPSNEQLRAALQHHGGRFHGEEDDLDEFGIMYWRVPHENGYVKDTHDPPGASVHPETGGLTCDAVLYQDGPDADVNEYVMAWYEFTIPIIDPTTDPNVAVEGHFSFDERSGYIHQFKHFPPGTLDFVTEQRVWIRTWKWEGPTPVEIAHVEKVIWHEGRRCLDPFECSTQDNNYPLSLESIHVNQPKVFASATPGAKVTAQIGVIITNRWIADNYTMTVVSRMRARLTGSILWQSPL